MQAILLPSPAAADLVKIINWSYTSTAEQLSIITSVSVQS